MTDPHPDDFPTRDVDNDLPPGHRRPNQVEVERTQAAEWRMSKPTPNPQLGIPDYSEVFSLPVTRAELEVLRESVLFEEGPLTPDVAIACTIIQDLVWRLNALAEGVTPDAAYERFNHGPDAAREESEWSRSVRRRTRREEIRDAVPVWYTDWLAKQLAKQDEQHQLTTANQTPESGGNIHESGEAASSLDGD